MNMEYGTKTLSKNLNYLNTNGNEVIHELTIDSKFFDKNNFLDKGFLFTAIDAVSSRSAFLFDQDLLFHVSINIKMNFLKEIIKPQEEMVIYIKTKVKRTKNLLFLDCSIYDKSGNIFVLATHLKRLINFKF
jgi:hypothetical protein